MQNILESLSRSSPYRINRTFAGCSAALLLLIGASCAEQAPPCPLPADAFALSAPPEPSCDNEALTGYDGLLVLAPHPDDEVLAFAGLITAYLGQGKPVDVVVVTDGDAYCEACRFWKSTAVDGPTCDAEDLSNFATTAVDSFAEIRRSESAAAASIVGFEAPVFLGYPDTGLAAAWRNSGNGELSKPLRRSDFSACNGCESCGYGEGPETSLTAASLMAALSARIADTSEKTLLATTHWLDGHGDHSGIGNFVKTLNAELEVPRPVAYAVVHAHTPKSAPHADCWYPGPEAPACPCADQQCATEDPALLSTLRAHRLRPEWPAALPDDADYGEEKQLCLPQEMYLGEEATKLAAVRSYKSQLGFLARTGSVPAHLGGIIDCNGYLISFVRRTEAFALIDPAAASAGSSPRGE